MQAEQTGKFVPAGKHQREAIVDTVIFTGFLLEISSKCPNIHPLQILRGGIMTLGF